MTPGLLHYILLALGVAATIIAHPTPRIDTSTDLPSNSVHQSGGKHHIVLFDSTLPNQPSIDDVLSRLGLYPEHEDVVNHFNGSGFRGFSANMDAHCLDALAEMSDVAIVEEVANVSMVETRSTAPWGLERISSAGTISGNPGTLNFTYSFDTGSGLGAGADIYILDSGINTQHVAFQDRAQVKVLVGSVEDGTGHGTHVSGIAAGMLVGVASRANILGIKMFEDNGTGSSDVALKAVGYAIDSHMARRNQTGFVGSVMNMSWRVPKINAMNMAIKAANDAGVHTIAAAGNDAEDACTGSPASSGGTGGNGITVGSIDISNAISKFSDTGSCVDVYAPGSNIVSAYIGGDNVIRPLTGTSMAAPHVAGIVAYLMTANQSLAQDPPAMKAFLKDTGLRDVITGPTLPGDPRILVNNGIRGK
ncbi:subtilisin-like protein [Trichodelitschia bisporula]|uniref:Subtilisin-like protein n=1 Tax=Trichodelitschia bisporula TaxID=703511 RepID=A0A6G1HNX6_9PEZI|nr:subtilisin-like protein [Trichodelitschia bisporula]